MVGEIAAIGTYPRYLNLCEEFSSILRPFRKAFDLSINAIELAVLDQHDHFSPPVRCRSDAQSGVAAGTNRRNDWLPMRSDAARLNDELQ